MINILRRHAGPRPPRQLTINILRHNPADPASAPQLQGFTLEEAEGMTLFIALNEIRSTQDPSLQFDFVCRAGICGSCAVLVDGRPRLACRTLTRDLGATISLAPLPFFELIGDLSVNTGKWMRGTSERLQIWIHNTAAAGLDAREAPMDPEQATAIYELDTNSTAASSAAAASPAAARRRCARNSSAPSVSTRSPASASTRATLAATRISTN